MYHGTFLQTPEGVVTREGDHMIETLNCPNEVGTYFFLVLPDTKQVASAAVKDPREFAYVLPYELHSLEELPEGFDSMIGTWEYTEEGGFKEYFCLPSWKYNCELSIKELKMEAATGADWVDVEAVRRFEEEVRNYKGEGPRPVFLNT